MRKGLSPVFSGRLNIAVPPKLVTATRQAAAVSMTTTNEYVRQAVLAKLRADGIEIAENERVAV